MTTTSFPGVVTEVLPNARYRCEAGDGREVFCHVSGEMRLKIVRILPGDQVTIEASPFDPSKGRILAKAEAPRRQA
jgi:translation initiation factor IF-1